jgi:hypothetical protein
MAWAHLLLRLVVLNVIEAIEARVSPGETLVLSVLRILLSSISYLLISSRLVVPYLFHFALHAASFRLSWCHDSVLRQGPSIRKTRPLPRPNHFSASYR